MRKLCEFLPRQGWYCAFGFHLWVGEPKCRFVGLEVRQHGRSGWLFRGPQPPVRIAARVLVAIAGKGAGDIA